MAPPKFATPPPDTPSFLLDYPQPHVLLITINRPDTMNSLPYESQWEAERLLQWFDSEPALRVAVITGAGKAFCAGQDLIEQGIIMELKRQQAQGEQVDDLDDRIQRHPPGGFGGVSRRTGKKPIIAAVNGFALGGGFELCLGCDIIVASPKAKFGLPEAQRGLYAAAGGLSRIVRLAGMTIASEVALAGRVLSAQEAEKFNIANRVTKTHESLLDEAVEIASRIADASPDAIIVTRAGLRQSWEDASVEHATQTTDRLYTEKLRKSQNLTIGLEAFSKKQKPNWVASKL